MIQISHLTKKYGATVAVDDLSLTLEPGKIYGFLGPNGAGKSTTMNVITGYIAATSGEVFINGHEINKEPVEAKKCIGYLPEQPPLYMDMMVGEYLRFAAELKQLGKEDRKWQIEKVMDMTGIADVENRLIRSLSKGYRQRVGLAQALLGFPETIIMDEPTVGLDPKQIIEIRDLIRTLSENHTVILSSHILTEISEVCDHVFIISRGKLVASDSMERLEQRMSGSQEVSLLLRADESAAEKIERLEQVEQVSARKGKEEDEVLISVHAAPGEDIRESLYRFCVREDLVILEMREITKTLEQVFLELTGPDSGGDPDDAGPEDGENEAADEPAGEPESAEGTEQAGEPESAEGAEQAGEPESAEGAERDRVLDELMQFVDSLPDDGPRHTQTAEDESAEEAGRGYAETAQEVETDESDI